MPTPANSTAGRLGAKLGPLPVWGWAVLAVGLYFGYRLLAGNSGGSDTPSVVGVSYPTGSQVTSGGSSDTGVGGSSGTGGIVDNLSGSYLDAYGQLVDAYGGINSALMGGLLASEQSLLDASESNGSLVGQLVGSLTDISTQALNQPPATAPGITAADLIALGIVGGGTPAVPAGTTVPTMPAIVEAVGHAAAPASGTSGNGAAPGSSAGGNGASDDWADYPILTFPEAPAASPDGGTVVATTDTPWTDFPVLTFPPAGSPPAAPSQTAAKVASTPKPKTTTHGGVTTVQTNAGPYGKKPLE